MQLFWKPISTDALAPEGHPLAAPLPAALQLARVAGRAPQGRAVAGIPPAAVRGRSSIMW